MLEHDSPFVKGKKGDCARPEISCPSRMMKTEFRDSIHGEKERNEKQLKWGEGLAQEKRETQILKVLPISLLCHHTTYLTLSHHTATQLSSVTDLRSG